MKTLNKPLRTSIESDKQRYLDQPQYAIVSASKPLDFEINAMYAPQPRVVSVKVPSGKSIRCQFPPRLRVPLIDPVIRTLTHYEHAPLNWVKGTAP